MATSFIGIHVVCAFAGANQNQIDIMRKPTWAHSVATTEIPGGSGFTATDVAPAADKVYGEPTFKVRAINTDIWVAVGESPDDPTVATSKREFVEAGTEKIFAVLAKDTFRWSVA